MGGLGLRELGRFNVSLLSKWIWQFLNEPSRLWVRVVQSRHGGLGMVYERTTYREGARRRGVRSAQATSGWWRDICNIYVGKEGRGVCNDIYKVIGNGEGTDFWRDIWAGDVPLCEKFNRLYRLSTQREDRVGDMGIWEEHGWRWDFKWRRGLRGRETEELITLIACIDRNIPRREEQDQWRWRHSGTGYFSTKIAFQQHRDGQETGSVTELRRMALNRLWGCHAPRRYQVIIWKLLHERMPTRDKLKLIGVIPETEVARCSWGCSAEEDVYHLFFTCQVVWQIWQKIYVWLGTDMVIHQNPATKFLHHGETLGSGKLIPIATTIWVAVTWTMWSHRNNLIFNGNEVNSKRIIFEIKSRSWSWLSVKLKEFREVDAREWFKNPRKAFTIQKNLR
ncbi:hypothetical protein ACS0TY_004859 [Phlomoides rotata]